MSEDGFSDSSDEPNMEIQIETLMGGSFDLRVSATDTVQEIKRRIHRVEGVPITHQNLLFQNRELQDSRRLVDVGIKDGAKLKLVLSMRGGPISTRRISTACEHQLMLKELKEFLDSTREEIDDRLAPGSKISVLVFKEGDIINLLRVIENEDGSYVPYSEKPISPPSKNTNRNESRTALFEKLVEDNKMMSNITTLRKKMDDVTARKKRVKNPKETNDEADNLLGETCAAAAVAFQMPDLSFKLLEHYKDDLFDDFDVKIFEKNDEKEEGNQSESEEIALKDKHRSKQIRSPRATSRISGTSSKSSLFAETKGIHSHTKHTYIRMQQHKKTHSKLLTTASSNSSSSSSSSVSSSADDKIEKEMLGSPILSPLCIQGGENTIDKTVVEEMTVTSNRLHVARLVISDNSERPKTTTETLDVEDNGTDLWSQRHNLKSATYKLGVLKRRQSSYGIDESSSSTTTTTAQELGDYNEVCSSSSSFYHMPTPSAIPPQYAPKNHQDICDFYCRNRPRSPLYGRKSSRDATATTPQTSCDKRDLSKYTKLPDIKSDNAKLFGDYAAGIQRLKNENGGGDLLFENEDAIDELCSYYNLGSDLLGEAKLLDRLDKTKNDEKIDLPPVIKKRARCNFCNRKLNITNIYNCRCGKIFCSQHRYSEVHHCNYDYKTDGRRFLEQQNPLVTADKINRF